MLANQPQLVIIDYGMGNVRSVQCALDRLGCHARISCNANDIQAADGLVLPGVGAFGKAMQNLEERGLTGILNQAVTEERKPILGICLGMQLFAESSTEMGQHKGLGWVPGEVELIDTGAEKLSLPHVGWNDIVCTDQEQFARIGDGAHFYFDHSYHFKTDERFISCRAKYGSDLVGAVRNDKIWGVQFHPEKSQTAGLKLLRNFINFVEANATC